MEQIDLSDDDKKSIEINSNTPIVNFLREMKTWSFNVGDVVVRYVKNKDGNGRKLSTISDTNPAPKKWKVVYIDDLGIPFVKIITKDGKSLSQTIMSLANQDHSQFCFALDPDYAEHIILDNVDGYDPMVRAKQNRERRKELNEHNRKLFTKLTFNSDAHAEIAKMQVGQKFWLRSTDGRGVAYHREYTVLAVQLYNNYADLQQGVRKNFYVSSHLDRKILTEPVWHLKVQESNYRITDDWATKDLVNAQISYEKPMELDDATF